jgi:hypothetical protein
MDPKFWERLSVRPTLTYEHRRAERIARPKVWFQKPRVGALYYVLPRSGSGIIGFNIQNTQPLFSQLVCLRNFALRVLVTSVRCAPVHLECDLLVLVKPEVAEFVGFPKNKLRRCGSSVRCFPVHLECGLVVLLKPELAIFVGSPKKN